MLLLFSLILTMSTSAQEVFPDGTPIPDWFRQNKPTDINKLGKHYRITDFNLSKDSTIIQTKKNTGGHRQSFGEWWRRGHHS